VVWTIRNPVNDGKTKSWWDEGNAGVCQAKYEFSCWNKNDPNFSDLGSIQPVGDCGQCPTVRCAEEQHTGHLSL
jgi:hypothetical protein